MEVCPLHTNKEYTTACAEILNQQWPRSMGARLHSLSKSCDTLPVSLAFVHDQDVIGFSKLSTVQGKQNSCLLECVIIRESDRGKRLGRALMELTEKYAKGKGIETIYLNTIDKEGFYAHLGYTKCKPVISLGENAHRVPESMLQQFMASSITDNDVQPVADVRDDPENENSSNSHKLHNLDTSVASLNGFTSDKEEKPLTTACTVCPSPASIVSSTTTTSSSSCAPPPPAPPPPPPVPTSLATQPKTSNRSITRLDPNQVIWMKKDIS